MKQISVLLLEEGQEPCPVRVDPSPENLAAILGQGTQRWIPLLGWRGDKTEFTSVMMVCREEDYKAMYRTHGMVPRRCLLCGVDRLELKDLYQIDRERLLRSYRKYGEDMFRCGPQADTDAGSSDDSLPVIRVFQDDVV